MQYGFGSGVLVGTRTDVAGSPRNFGILQEVMVDFDAPLKELLGTYQFPVAVARGKGKITGKAKFANIDLGVYNDLFFGSSAVASGETQFAVNESHPAATGTPFQVTVTNGATFAADEGVFFASSTGGSVSAGKFMTQMPIGTSQAALVTGQYTVTTAGVYTFSTADCVAGNVFYFNYTYTTAGTGHTLTLTNQLLGVQPTFKLVLAQSYTTQQLVLTLNQCVASKLGFATKLEDFQIPDFGFGAFADASNTIGSISTTQ